MENIIIKYIENRASHNEKLELLDWLNESDDNLKKFHELADIMSLTSSLDDKTIDLEFYKLYNKINESSSRLSTPQRWLLKTIASVAAVIALCLVSYFIGKNGIEPISITPTVIHHYTTGSSVKERMILPDSSVVWLNENTTITYPAQFANDKRIIGIEGEAYFDVVKDTQRPFTVSTKDLEITVLGTSFDLNSRSTKQSSSAVLIEGKVSVKDREGNQFELNPNDKIIFDRLANKSTIEYVEASDYIIWAQDKLELKNQNLIYILNKLKYWYNVDVDIAANIPQNVILSLSIRKENKEDMFRMLKQLAPIDYKIDKEKNSIEVFAR